MQDQESGLVSAVPAPLQSPSESSSKVMTAKTSTTTARVKLPLGVPPIPRIIEQPKEDAERRVPLRKPADSLVGDNRAQNSARIDAQQAAGKLRRADETMLDRQDADGWFKMKAGAQEVGESRHEKSG